MSNLLYLYYNWTCAESFKQPEIVTDLTLEVFDTLMLTLNLQPMSSIGMSILCTTAPECTAGAVK